MRVAIAAEGTRGDVYPMLGLAGSLRAAGHAVRLCVPPDFEAEALAAGSDFVSLRSEVRSFLSAGAAAIHGGALAMMREMARWGELSLANQFAVLPDAVAGCDFVIGAGTIVIHSASEAGRQVFDNVRNPEHVQKTIYHEGEKNQQRMRGGLVAPQAPTVTSELSRLADLRDRGVLTQQEFEEQKARILGGGAAPG